MNSISPILIVGAGPTGLMAAIELTRFGLPVRIVEKLKERSPTSRALAIQARTLELLDQRGLTAEMVRLGNPAYATTIYENEKAIGRVDLSRIKSRFNYILLLPQSETERLLEEKLEAEGVHVDRGTEMVGFSQTDRGVQATLRKADGSIELLDASYMISCEGAHSVARKTLGLRFDGTTIEQRYALADVHIDTDVPEDELSIFTSAEGFLGIFPMGKKRFRFIATDENKSQPDSSAPSIEEITEIFRRVTGKNARVYDQYWSSRFRINSRMLNQLRSGRVFFGGDSAHIHSPAGGQGMNTGLQDMINLCWKLAFVIREQAKPALLRTYDEERLPVIRAIVNRTERATESMNSKNPVVHSLIRTLAPIVLGQSFVQNDGTAFIGEISANYRASSLSRNPNPFASLQAGDRLPDFKLASGESVHSLLNPSKFTLLKLHATSADLTPWKDLIQVEQIRLPEVPQTAFILVRPDGYIGHLGGGESWTSFQTWMENWLTIA